jgi:hypothetical protein
MKRSDRFAVLLMAALTAACATTPRPSMPTGRAAGDRALSPFYAWTASLPAQPGVMLRTEPVSVQPELNAAAVAQRMLYTSTDVRWQAGIVPVSGTLYLPRGTPPPGGWPLLAWAHGTLGVADVCAPSWAQHRPRDATYLNRWLDQGFAVVATDYQGLGGPGPHPYLIWEAEGRSVLDSARAALSAHAGRIANAVVISGQSQGAGSALGASRIAPSYAPEIGLRATIATGIVTTFPDGPQKLPDPVPGSGAPSRFTMLRLIGGSIPDAGPSADSLVSERGRALLALAREACVDEMRAFEQKERLDLTSAFQVEPARLQALMSPVTDMSAMRLPAPVFLGTGLADRTIPPRRQHAAAAALCAAGNPLVWKTYAGITHNGIVNAAFDDEVAFVRRALGSQANESNCSTLTEPAAPGPATAGIPFND